jgi:hypothetical protein
MWTVFNWLRLFVIILITKFSIFNSSTDEPRNNHHSVLGTVNSLRIKHEKVLGSITGRNQRFFPSPKRPDFSGLRPGVYSMVTGDSFP